MSIGDDLRAGRLSRFEAIKRVRTEEGLGMYEAVEKVDGLMGITKEVLIAKIESALHGASYFTLKVVARELGAL